MKAKQNRTPPHYDSSATTLGYVIMAAVFFFTFIGYQLDRKFKNDFNLFTLLGIFAGLLYGGYEVWRLIQREQEYNKKTKDSHRRT